MDATLAELRTKGLVFSDFKGTPGAINVRPDGMRAVFLEDPNGYWIEINDWKWASVAGSRIARPISDSVPSMIGNMDMKPANARARAKLLAWLSP